jgi:dCMP deaminase
MQERISWDEYFIQSAELIARRSTCMRRQVGAVLVKDNRIIASGYNGAPSGIKHCGDREEGCLRMAMNIKSGERHELCRAIHAEQNALIQCSKNGVSAEGATCYVTVSPCIICLKMLINAGVKKIVTYDYYPDELSKELLEESGIEIVVLKK